MKVKLAENRIYRNTVNGVKVEIGGEPVEVDDEIGEYLLKYFPTIIERVPEKEKKTKEV